MTFGESRSEHAETPGLTRMPGTAQPA